MYNESIEDILGQTKIYNTIIEHVHASANYLITAPTGKGKHYLINQLIDTLEKMPNVCVLRCHIQNIGIDSGLDFAPFLAMLSIEEKTTITNGLNASMPFVELIPYIGKCISKLSSQKKIYPVAFNNTETELLERIQRVVGSRVLILICEEVELWDKASFRFLQKLLCFPFSINKQNIICTSAYKKEEIGQELTSFDSCFDLNSIKEEHMNLVAETLFPKINLTPLLLKKICQLSGGNIGMILQLVKFVNTNNDGLIGNHQAYHDLILCKLRESLSKGNYEKAVELLDRASLIGERVYRKLLEVFWQYDLPSFIESIDDVVKQDIMNDEAEYLSFSYRVIWQTFYDHNSGNKRFHHELVKSIQKLTPSNYFYIADELYKAGEYREAAINYILAALSDYYMYHSLPILSPKQVELLKQYKLYNDYQQLIDLYSSCINGDFIGVQQTFFHCYERQLSFESDYIRAIAKINGSILQSDYSEALLSLQNWVEDEDFCENSPVQWMRAAQLAIGAQYELHNETMFCLLKKIDQISRKYIASDYGVQWLKYNFLARCNYCYMIDTAYYYTKDAFIFFKEHLKKLPTKYPYYVALINYSANATVLGKYHEAIDLLSEGLVSLEREIVPQGVICSLINNLLVSEYLGKQIKTVDEIELSIAQMNTLIEAMVKDIITSILLRNNQIVMFCYNGDYASAARKIEILYDEIRTIDDVDDYYLYIVGNNYHIIRHLAGIKAIDKTLMEQLFQLRPLDHDHKYFEMRQKVLLEQLSQGNFPNLLNQDWNSLPGSLQVGPAWSFWGKWILFSDLQIWSD